MSSKNKKSFKLLLKKYMNIRNWSISFALFLISPIMILIFVFGLKKQWYDALSVSGLIDICLSLLIIIFDIAQFKTFSKLKNLFVIKKENNEPFTKAEQAQMKALNIIKESDYNEKNSAKIKDLKTFLFIFLLLLGLISLVISLPFVFIK